MRSTRRPRGPRDVANGLTSRRRMLAGALGIGLSGLAIGPLAACDPADPGSGSGSGDPDGSAPGADPTTTPTPEPDPDLALLEAAVATEEELLAAYAATSKAHAALADLLKPMAANHRAHLTYLTALVAVAAEEPLPAPLPDPATTATETPTDDPTAEKTQPIEPVPESESAAIDALTAAEQQAATAHLGDVKTAVGGDVARLFASLSACAQSHAFRFELNGDAYVS